jgi:LysR family transcriptional regulator, regulator for genes of the gallate degradation pathway
LNDTEHSRLTDTISFRQLKLFESVGRLMSVRRGSEECNLSQPAVTQALARLEQQVGITLLERGASGSYLTEAGKIFHLRVGRMFDQLEDALFELNVPGGQLGAQSIANRISRAQVRSLVGIIECGSFALAAATLGITQASLQRAARDLESNLRKSIYYRSAAGVMVTTAGIEFGRKVNLATREIDWGINEIEVARGNSESKIVIGALPFGGTVLLASVLGKFVSAHPNANVSIVNEGAVEMIRRLRAGDVDLAVGIVQQSSNGDLVNELLAETPYEIVARRGHPLTCKGKDIVSTEELSHYDWVIGTEGATRRTCFDTLFVGEAMPKASIATSSLLVIRQLLAQSDRLTLMTSFELMQEMDVLAVVPFRPIRPVPALGITMRANWLPTRLHQDFIDLLRTHVKESAELPAVQLT